VWRASAVTAAAPAPLPSTSPIVAIQPPATAKSSKKSPPTSLASPAGACRHAASQPSTSGRSGGRRLACSVRAICTRSVNARALATASPARHPISSASIRSSSSKARPDSAETNVSAPTGLAVRAHRHDHHRAEPDGAQQRRGGARRSRT
jgi:hypothetical protein